MSQVKSMSVLLITWIRDLLHSVFFDPDQRLEVDGVGIQIETFWQDYPLELHDHVRDRAGRQDRRYGCWDRRLWERGYPLYGVGGGWWVARQNLSLRRALPCLLRHVGSDRLEGFMICLATYNGFEGTNEDETMPESNVFKGNLDPILVAPSQRLLERDRQTRLVSIL